MAGVDVDRCFKEAESKSLLQLDPLLLEPLLLILVVSSFCIFAARLTSWNFLM
jgi:hypothetical protein